MDELLKDAEPIRKKNVIGSMMALLTGCACLTYIYSFTLDIVLRYKPFYMEMRMELPKPTKFFLLIGSNIYAYWYLFLSAGVAVFVLLPAIESVVKRTLLPQWVYIVLAAVLALFSMAMYSAIMMPIFDVQRHLQRM